jgi:hydrogenase nickel incorporation protein HypA/HybF
MHEMAYAEAILDVALDVSEGRPVRGIQVRLGAAHAIVAESLQFCFEMAAQETPAAEARLEVQIIPGEDFLVDAVELEEGWRQRPSASVAGT